MEYIWTHTKEIPSKISNITFAIFAFFLEKKILKPGRPEHFGIYSW